MATPPVNPPAVAPAAAPITLSASRLSVVTVRGVSYQYTVTGVNGQCEDLVRNHIEYLLTTSGKGSFDSIKSVLKKRDPAAGRNQAPFTLESSQVEYLSKKGGVKSKNALVDFNNKPRAQSPQTATKVQKYWDATQRSLIELTQGAPFPAQPNPNQAPVNPAAPTQLQPANGAQPPAAVDPQPIVEVQRNVITPYSNRAKRMPVSNGQANQLRVELALAKQLSQMPNASGGKSKYNGISDAQIAQDLRTKYVKYIDDHKNDYLTNPKEMIDNLTNAKDNDNQRLTEACEELGTQFGGRLFGGTDTNIGQLTTMLTNPINSLTEDQKNDLIKIHNRYVAKGGSVNESSFLDAFVKIHNPASSPDKFEVIVIRPDDAKPYLCADNSPGAQNRLPKSENSCAFLRVDAQGRYESIPRGKRQFALGEALTSARNMPDNNNANRNVSDELGLLVDLFDTYDNASLKGYVMNAETGLPINYPQVYDRLKRFIYEHDRINNVGGRGINQGLDNEHYGQLALEAITPDELATLLMNNRGKVLAVGKNPEIFNGLNAF